MHALTGPAVRRVYADFDDPASFLLQQRLVRSRIPFEWCPVVARRDLPVSGRALNPHELRHRDHVRALALPHEVAPMHTSWAVNTGASVAAYAESISDGKHDEMRMALLAAIHLHGLNISRAWQVRSVVVGVMLRDCALRPRGPAAQPWVRPGATTPQHLVRLMGATVTRTGAALTTAGQRRADAWTREWRDHGSLPLPLVVVDGEPRAWGLAAVEVSGVPGCKRDALVSRSTARRPLAVGASS